MFTYRQENVWNKVALTKFCMLIETWHSIKCNRRAFLVIACIFCANPVKLHTSNQVN
jgi:hypothetical protein